MHSRTLVRRLRHESHSAWLRGVARHALCLSGSLPPGTPTIAGDPMPHQLGRSLEHALAKETVADAPLNVALLQGKADFDLAVLNESVRRQAGLRTSFSGLARDIAELPTETATYLARHLTGIYRQPAAAAEAVVKAAAGMRSLAQVEDLAETIVRAPSAFGTLVGRSWLGVPSVARSQARSALRDSAVHLVGSATVQLGSQRDLQARADRVLRDVGLLRMVQQQLADHLGGLIEPAAADSGLAYRRTPESALAALQTLAAVARLEAGGDVAHRTPTSSVAIALNITESALLPDDLVWHAGAPADDAFRTARADALASRAAAEAVAVSQLRDDIAGTESARAAQQDIEESFDVDSVARYWPSEAAAITARRRSLFDPPSSRTATPWGGMVDISPDVVYAALRAQGPDYDESAFHMGPA